MNDPLLHLNLTGMEIVALLRESKGGSVDDLLDIISMVRPRFADKTFVIRKVAEKKHIDIERWHYEDESFLSLVCLALVLADVYTPSIMSAEQIPVIRDTCRRLAINYRDVVALSAIDTEVAAILL